MPSTAAACSIAHPLSDTRHCAHVQITHTFDCRQLLYRNTTDVWQQQASMRVPVYICGKTAALHACHDDEPG